MEKKIDDEFREICTQILNENKSEKEWASIESSDMFQTEHYCGGFDATENAFCFSYYSPTEKEYWFQISMNEVQNISSKKLSSLKMRNANS
jgi:hypothetical protein